MSRKTKYNKTWTESYSWISPVRNNEYSARCEICIIIYNKDFFSS